jgi:hypothetical protein
MSHRYSCPQGHQWEAESQAGVRPSCPFCGAEPSAPGDIQTSPEPHTPRKAAPAADDLPSVLAAEPARPPKSKRSVAACAVLGCFGFVLVVLAIGAGIGGWFYYSAREMEMRRARAVVERHLNEQYQNRWKIDSESLSPGLTEAAFEGKADPLGSGSYNQKFTIILSKYNDGRWYIDE